MNLKKKALEKHYEENFDSLVEKIGKRIYQTDEAEDIVQTAYSKAMLYLDKYNPARRFSNYFNIILNNSLNDYLRDTMNNRANFFNPETEEDEGEFRDDTYAVEDRELDTDHLQVRMIKGVIANKTGNTREILTQYFLSNYPPADISKALGITNGVVRQIIYNFKQEMRGKNNERDSDR